SGRSCSRRHPATCVLEARNETACSSPRASLFMRYMWELKARTSLDWFLTCFINTQLSVGWASGTNVLTVSTVCHFQATKPLKRFNECAATAQHPTEVGC